MSQPTTTASAAPEPTRTPKGEPGTLDKIPAQVAHMRTAPDMIRQMTKGEVFYTSEFCQIEEAGDGTMCFVFVCLEDQKIHNFRVPLLTGLQIGQGAVSSYQTSTPEARAKLIVDLTDRSYANDQLAREREREAVMLEARRAAGARQAAPREPAPWEQAPAEEPQRAGLVARMARGLLELLAR